MLKIKATQENWELLEMARDQLLAVSLPKLANVICEQGLLSAIEAIQALPVPSSYPEELDVECEAIDRQKGYTKKKNAEIARNIHRYCAMLLKYTSKEDIARLLNHDTTPYSVAVFLAQTRAGAVTILRLLRDQAASKSEMRLKQ